MASVTLAQAAVLSQIPLTAGIVNEIITRDLFASQLPFLPCQGRGLTTSRELTEHGATWLDINGNVDKTQATATNVTHYMGRLAGDVEIDEFEAIAMSNDQDVIGAHLARLTRRILRQWQNGIINGTGTFPQPTGLLKLCTTTQTVQANHAEINTTTTAGVAVTLKNLDILADQVTADGDQPFLMAHSAVIRAFKVIVRASGSDENYVELGFLNPLTGQRSIGRVLSLGTIPFFTNDHIGTTTVSGHSGRRWVIAGIMGGEGVHGLMPTNAGNLVKIYPPMLDNTRNVNILRGQMIAGMTTRSTRGLALLKNVKL